MRDFDYENNLFLENADVNAEAKNILGIKITRFIKALDYLKPKSKVLDIACGVGIFTGIAKKYRKDLEVIGVDISHRALKLASAKYPEVVFIQSDISELPYPDAHFDMVCGFDVLEHIKDVDRVLKEVQRVVKPNGYVHFHIPCEGEPFTLWWFLWKIRLGGDIKKIHAGHIQRFTSKHTKKIVKEAGFKIIGIEYSYHCLGQFLDFIQWEATAIRKNAETKNMDIGTIKSGYNTSNITKIGLKAYYFLIHVLEISSYYESKMLSKVKPSMALDITAQKIFFL